MAPKDARRIPGMLVEIRAVVFMALSECVRQYRSNKTTKVLSGHVLSSEKLSSTSGKTSQTLVTIEMDLGDGNKKVIATGIRHVKAVPMENLGDNGGGCTSTGSTHVGAPDPKMQMETLKKLQGQIVAIRALLYLSPALLLLNSWLIPPMRMERKIDKV
jgi:hypothetical protein